MTTPLLLEMVTPFMPLTTEDELAPCLAGLDPAGAVARILLARFAEATRPVLIAVGGPGGTGKTTFSRALAARLPDAGVLRLDDYKTPRSERAERGLYGPHPEANRFDLMGEHLAALKRGRPVQKPVYCRTCGEGARTEEMAPGRFVVLDGEVATYPQVRDYADLCIYIDADLRTQLMARVERDIEKRGYDWDKAISTFLHSNLREFRNHGAPSKPACDIHLHCREDYSLLLDWVSPTLTSTLPAGLAVAAPPSP